MADKTIGELPAVPIGELPPAPDIYDETLIPVEQQGTAKHITGAQWKGYAQASVTQYIDSAKEQADAAAQSAKDAAQSAEQAAGSATDAADSAQSAKEYSGNPPIIKEGTWWTWNAELKDYEDTGETAKNDISIPTFYLDETTGELYMYADEGYTGPEFQLRDGYLEVVLDG